ncbi:hypothetical protein D6B98_39535 [Bradyrhizobium sp. LVM 105]|nr:hypothetical protein D6B98_39535 [Bradyrhizobium sp. LVM 105]
MSHNVRVLVLEYFGYTNATANGHCQGGSLKIVCCHYVRLINSHTPMTMRLLHDREPTSELVPQI